MKLKMHLGAFSFFFFLLLPPSKLIHFFFFSSRIALKDMFAEHTTAILPYKKTPDYHSLTCCWRKVLFIDLSHPEQLFGNQVLMLF